MNIVDIITAKLQAPKTVLRIQISNDYVTISALNGNDQISRKVPVIEIMSAVAPDALVQDAITRTLSALTR